MKAAPVMPRKDPLRYTNAPDRKFVPLTVRVIGPPLFAPVVGLIEMIVGEGGGVTVRLKADDVPAGAGSTK